MSVNLPREKNLNVLYLELFRFIQNGEYERAIKMCNKILNVDPKESKAYHCKIVCLIHLSRFEDCIQQLTKQADLSRELYFEKAYCEYRLNDSENALRTINTAPKLTEQLMELKAQVLYRLECFKESYSLYREILKHTNDDYDDERQTNISALCAFVDVGEDKPKSDAVTYEILYNKAFKHIICHEYTQAERLLVSCEKMCRESLEEDGCSEEEIEQEMGFIRVQLAYCCQKQGRVKDAQELYTTFLKAKLGDAGLTAVASNNMVAINKDQNLFDSKKKMKAAMQECMKHKLNLAQSKVISINHCLLLYYMNQPENCRKFCERLTELWPDDQTTAAIIRALLLSREGKIEQAISLLRKLSEEQPANKLYLQLTATQLLLNAGEHKKACDALHDLGENTYRPGIVGTLVSLHLALGDKAGAAKVFEDTVAFYKSHQEAQGDVGYMWLQASEFHMKYGNASVAAGCLEQLLRTKPGNKRTIAKLIMAYVQCDPGKAEILSKQLPSLEDLTKDLDEADLESNTWVYGIKPTRSTGSPGTPRSENEKTKRRKKRKNKTLLPPGVYLDPERWLPKYERTGFKKRRDRRAKDIIKGSQGSAVSISDAYDFTGKAVQMDDPGEVSESKSSTMIKKPQVQRKKKKSSRK